MTVDDIVKKSFAACDREILKEAARRRESLLLSVDGYWRTRSAVEQEIEDYIARLRAQAREWLESHRAEFASDLASFRES